MSHDSAKFKAYWHALALAERFGNIGSEVSRAMKWQSKDEGVYQRTLDRALDLIDLTISDARWRYREKELTRFREFFCDALEGGKEYQSSFEYLERYCTQFAVLRRS